MAFKPMNTKDETTSFRKSLLYSLAGWGKTTQAKHYQAAYGKGFIISGEAGLSSIRGAGIDYLPFTSFDGAFDESKGVYSFVQICRIINSPEFKAVGYKWLMLDSLTELSDMVFGWADAKATATAAATGKKQNGFEVWGDYKDRMIGACKYIRDLPYHVVVTALSKTNEDDNGDKQHIPLLQGNAVQAQIPGIFDNVFCGTTRLVKTGEVMTTQRVVITSAFGGWQGKVRDESGLIQAVEETGDITTIMSKMDATTS